MKLSFIPFIALFLACVLTQSAQAMELATEENVLSLGLNEVSQLSLAESLGIKVLHLADSAYAQNLSSAKSKYDTNLFLSGTHTRDKTPSSSIFAGELAEEFVMEGGVEQEMPWGSEMVATWTTDRDETDSTFVSLNPSYTTTGTLSIAQPLMKNAWGMVDRDRLETIALDVKRFNFETLAAIERHVFDVRRAFWETWKTKQNLSIERQGLKDAQHFYDITVEKKTLGMLEDPDILEAKANVEARAIDELLAHNAYGDAMNALKNILSLPLNSNLSVNHVELKAPVSADRAELIRKAMEARYDRQSALLQLQKMDLNVQIAVSNRWPRLDLEGTLGIHGLNRDHERSSSQAFRGNTPSFGIGFVMDYPLQNRDAMSKLKKSRYEKQKAILALDDLELSIEKEVDQAFREVLTTRETLLKTNGIVGIQLQKLDSEMKRFQQGRSNSNRIVDYQLDVLTAKRQRAWAKTQHAMALDELEMAQSQLLTPYSLEENSQAAL